MGGWVGSVGRIKERCAGVGGDGKKKDCRELNSDACISKYMDHS